MSLFRGSATRSSGTCLIILIVYSYIYRCCHGFLNKTIILYHLIKMFLFEKSMHVGLRKRKKAWWIRWRSFFFKSSYSDTYQPSWFGPATYKSMYKKEKCPYSLLVIFTFSTHMHVLPTFQVWFMHCAWHHLLSLEVWKDTGTPFKSQVPI